MRSSSSISSSCSLKEFEVSFYLSFRDLFFFIVVSVQITVSSLLEIFDFGMSLSVFMGKNTCAFEIFHIPLVSEVGTGIKAQ